MTDAAVRLAAALSDRYRIERELGAGGMATVYLAADLKHDRKVAIKVLKPELAAVLGAERFVVEIKTTASLSHPHILPLFDSGTADGFLFYVMPFIAGETIREKLNRESQFGVEEAVRIACEVADALDYAHRRGVIHRDIKPENLLLHDGRAMVMDFGIALAVSAAAGGRMTETGLSLGTPHYMSPEQATADKDISPRSDIYSLASVLFEMLAGEPPHTGGTAQAVIMKIITDVARPVHQIRKNVPPNVDAALSKALEKLPADRFENARAFADALGNAAFTSTTTTRVPAAVVGSRWKQRAAVPLAIALFASIGVAGWLWSIRSQPAPVTRFDLALGAPAVLGSSDVVISPDGAMLAFVGVVGAEQPSIYLRNLSGDPDFRKVPGTEGVNASPTFSPDSRSIAFRQGQGSGTLVRMALSGGGTTTLTRIDGPGTYLHWGTDDQIVYSGGPAGLFRIAATGGTPEFLAKSAGALRYSFLLPDGSGLLFSRSDGVVVLTFATDSVTLLVPNALHPTYIATGHLLYIAEAGGLFAVPFDLGSHRVTGPAAPLIGRVAASVGQRGYSVSRSGTLVFHDGAPSTRGAGVPNRLAVVDFKGNVTSIPLPAGMRNAPRFAPNGRIIAYDVLAGRQADRDIHTFDLVTATDTRLTFAGDNIEPIWSPDGKRILFSRRATGAGGASAPMQRDGGNLFIKSADNSGPEQQVLSKGGHELPDTWLAGDTILFTAFQVGQAGDVLSYSLRDTGAPKPYLNTTWAERDARISPDGKLGAFTSSEAGGNNIWIRDFPDPKGKWQVSSSNGQAARWSRDGKYVYYWKGLAAAAESLFRARVDRTPSVVVRAPEFILALAIAGGPRNWDLHPDGTKFVVALPELTPPSASGSPAGQASRYIIVQNWFTELKAATSLVKK